MKRKVDYGIVVQGGQGRDEEAVKDAAFWFGVSMVCVVIVVILGLLGLFKS